MGTLPLLYDGEAGYENGQENFGNTHAYHVGCDGMVFFAAVWYIGEKVWLQAEPTKQSA